MPTPRDAPYKLRQREYEKRVRYRGRYTPSDIDVQLDPTLKRHVPLNRATRRELERYARLSRG